VTIVLDPVKPHYRGWENELPGTAASPHAYDLGRMRMLEGAFGSRRRSRGFWGGGGGDVDGPSSSTSARPGIPLGHRRRAVRPLTLRVGFPSLI